MGVLNSAAFCVSQTPISVTDHISLFTSAAGELRILCTAHQQYMCFPVCVFVQTSLLIPFDGPALVFLSLPLSICTTLTPSLSLAKLPTVHLEGGRARTQTTFKAGRQM